MATTTDGKVACPRCGSGDVQSKGKEREDGSKQYMCNSCARAHRKKWFYFPDTKEKLSEKIVETPNSREISSIVPERITNVQQLVSQCEIDIGKSSFDVRGITSPNIKRTSAARKRMVCRHFFQIGGCPTIEHFNESRTAN